MDWRWRIRSTDGGMNGLDFANATTSGDQTRVLLHAAPSEAHVQIVTEDGDLVAEATLKHQGEEAPMTVLDIEDGRIERTDAWLDQEHLGCVVILPGGEAGILTAWEHAEDRSWWRWSVEFSNQA